MELCSCTGVWNIHPLWKNQDHCKVTAFYPKNLANKCIFIWSGKLKGTKNASNHLQSTMFTNLLFVTYNGHEKSIISKVDFVMTFMGSHRPRPNSCLTRHIFYSFILWCARVDIITNFDYKQSLLCCEVIYHRFCAVWKIWSNVWNIWSRRYEKTRSGKKVILASSLVLLPSFPCLNLPCLLDI